MFLRAFMTLTHTSTSGFVLFSELRGLSKLSPLHTAAESVDLHGRQVHSFLYTQTLQALVMQHNNVALPILLFECTAI
jgi:hypothetical protein